MTARAAPSTRVELTADTLRHSVEGLGATLDWAAIEDVGVASGAKDVVQCTTSAPVALRCPNAGAAAELAALLTVWWRPDTAPSTR